MELLIKLGIVIVEAMFVTGAIGSFVVIIWVAVEDFDTIFKRDEEAQ